MPAALDVDDPAFGTLFTFGIVVERFRSLAGLDTVDRGFSTFLRAA